MKNRRLFLLLFQICMFTACNSLRTALVEQSAYEKYLSSLEKGAFKNSPMVLDWKNAGIGVFSDSVTILQLPYRETGYFPSTIPQARGFRFKMKKGQALVMEGATQKNGNTQIFGDLFVQQGQHWKRLAESDTTMSLSYEFDEDVVCVLRLQPELSSTMYYTITLSAKPALLNPVSGASNNSIGSLFGAVRDAGKRTHEGVDIFALKGTPVIAPTGGIITSTTSNNLGGNVIWMTDVKRGLAYYFAHLDAKLVHPGSIVQAGDTIGLVGNSGNARHTAPHLHFGIYKNGSRDPLYYIKTMQQLEGNAKAIDTNLIPTSFRINTRAANLRRGPGEMYSVIKVLPKHTHLILLARSKNWYRVELPDHTQGYISPTLTAKASPKKHVHVMPAFALLSEAADTADPVWYVEQQGYVQALAYFGSFMYVQTEDGKMGWMASRE